MIISIKGSLFAALSVSLSLQNVDAQYGYGYGHNNGWGGGGNHHHHQDVGSRVNFDTCACPTSDLALSDFDDFTESTPQGSCNALAGFYGSQARTWTNLCLGSRGRLNVLNDDFLVNAGSNSVGATEQGDEQFFSIQQRNGDPFREFCRLIAQYPNVMRLLGRGNSPHTVFAPTDTAFDKVSNIVGQIDELKVLEIHILPTPRLTYDIRCGQTYRPINTDNNKRNRQRVKIRCVTASQTQVLGPGNYNVGHRPTIGIPNNIFNAWQFSQQQEFTNLHTQRGTSNNAITSNFNLEQGNDQNGYNYLFSENVVSCNGIIHVVDNVILPGNNIGNSVGGYYNTFRSGGAKSPVTIRSGEKETPAVTARSGGENTPPETARSGGEKNLPETTRSGRIDGRFGFGGYYGPGMGYYGPGKGNGGLGMIGYYGPGKGKGGAGLGYYGPGKGKGSPGMIGYYGPGKGKGGSGYFGSGFGPGKGKGNGIGKGNGRRPGKGKGKGVGGYGYGYYYGYYYGYGKKGGKGHKGHKGYKGYKGYGKHYYNYPYYGWYRRGLEEEEDVLGESDEEGEEYLNFLSPDFDENEFFGNDEEEDDDDDDEDYYGEAFYDEEELLPSDNHVGRIAQGEQQNENENKDDVDMEALAAATEEKHENRKRRLEALLEPNGEIAQVEV